ncbi:putative late blight resistance protein homolog R1A-3 [Henckelia pumila]|uniref:putative late blight resistance protein homolog R1A-3 n=1 Tax=Henckelia pumila TaxID=405737 RepID=UPI003C6DC2BC
MDDVWDTKVWDDVKRFFPDDGNGSRIVLTTRSKNVGDYASSTGCLHDMSFLSYSESWNLFHEKVFRGECCRPRLEGIGLEIIRNCIGLPLSIVVIGGLISMDKTVNYVIRRSKLIKLWIAEGFIKPNDESKSLEEIAEKCLEDLLSRSLIMVLELGHCSKVKTYKIHDLLRDFCIAEVQKEKFFHLINRDTPRQPEGIRNERRVSILPLTPFKSSEHIPNSNELPFPTRSLLLYHQDAHIIISENSFELLRVLDMESGVRLLEFPMELPLEVWAMPHLRHVQIRNIDCRLPDPPYSRVEKLRVIYDVKSEDWSQFHLSNIVCLNELESLHIKSYSNIAFPPNFKFPAALKKLTLSGCRLRSEDLNMVGSFPNLEVLKLHHDAFRKSSVGTK